MYMMSDSGRDITLYRLYPGDICMLTASCVLAGITFDVFADAQEDSQCYVISGPAFANFRTQSLYKNLCAGNRGKPIFRRYVGHAADTLYEHGQKAGDISDRRNRPHRSGQHSLTHEQIARYMGSAREVISRMLKYFSSEGIVELSRKGIKILDKNRLRALAY